MPKTKLEDMSVRQIDTELADLVRQNSMIEQEISRRESKIKRMGSDPAYKDLVSMDQNLIDLAKKQLDKNARRIASLDRQFAKRGGWSRFYLTQGSNGHIHSNTACSTCNKNGKITIFGWLPDLSGLSEEDAVAKHGAILCTVCFPSAPVHWTDGRGSAKEEGKCASSGTDNFDPSKSRTGFYTGNSLHCNECGKNVSVRRGLSDTRLPSHKTNTPKSNTMPVPL